MSVYALTLSCLLAVTLRPAHFVPERMPLWGNLDSARTLVLSPDGQLLATGGENALIRLWDTHTGRELRSMQGHRQRVMDLTFSPNGRLLASTSTDGTSRLWEVRTGHEIAKLSPGRPGGPVVFAPDGRSLAVAEAGAIRLWEVATRMERLTLPMPRFHAAYGMVFTPDGNALVAMAYADGPSPRSHLWVWDLLTGKARTWTTDLTGGMALSPDGKLVAVTGPNDTVQLRQMPTASVLLTLWGHTDRVLTIRFSPDSRVVATAGQDQTVRLWDTRVGRGLHTMRGLGGDVICVTFSPDSRTAAACAHNGQVKLWDVVTGQELASFTAHAMGAWFLEFTADGKHLVSAGGKTRWAYLGDLEEIKVWDAMPEK